MKEQKFIIEGVKKHLQASARKNKYRVIDVVHKIPTFDGFILPYYVSTMEGDEIPGKRRGYVHLLRRVGGVLHRDGSQDCTSYFGNRPNQRDIN